MSTNNLNCRRRDGARASSAWLSDDQPGYYALSLSLSLACDLCNPVHYHRIAALKPRPSEAWQRPQNMSVLAGINGVRLLPFKKE